MASPNPGLPRRILPPSTEPASKTRIWRPNLAPWQLLLHKTVEGLARLRAAGQPIPQWVLGGGTALMIHARHRLSKDIDVFIDDPQYLSFLSPRLAGEGIWECKAYEESANHLRLVYSE